MSTYTFTLSFDPLWVKLICAYIIWLVLPVAVQWDKQISFGYRYKEPFWQILTLILGLALVLTLLFLRLIAIALIKIATWIDVVSDRYGKYVFPDKK
ncbi:hypothetical protein EAb13_CDS0049 [Acinetobacter phage EAb13]|nr:hypothetical protein EAb13_CDS0049 [Acinetobacter phage EAb13]